MCVCDAYSRPFKRRINAYVRCGDGAPCGCASKWERKSRSVSDTKHFICHRSLRFNQRFREWFMDCRLSQYVWNTASGVLPVAIRRVSAPPQRNIQQWAKISRFRSIQHKRCTQKRQSNPIISNAWQKYIDQKASPVLSLSFS